MPTAGARVFADSRSATGGEDRVASPSPPEDTPLPELVRLGKIRWRVEHDYRELKTGLGLDHFEGRTFTGWHRHVTLVTAAQLFLTSLRHDPKVLVSA